MKALALKLIMKVLRLVGLRTLLNLVWKKAVFPKLKELVEESDEEWDDELLEFIDSHVIKAISNL